MHPSSHIKKALTEFPPPWKVIDCPSGESCWCAMIVTDRYHSQSDEEKEMVFGSASVHRDMAHLIVAAVNNYAIPNFTE